MLVKLSVPYVGSVGCSVRFILYHHPSSVSLVCLLTQFVEMYPFIPPEDGPLRV